MELLPSIVSDPVLWRLTIGTSLPTLTEAASPLRTRILGVWRMFTWLLLANAFSAIRVLPEPLMDVHTSPPASSPLPGGPSPNTLLTAPLAPAAEISFSAHSTPKLNESDSVRSEEHTSELQSRE